MLSDVETQGGAATAASRLANSLCQLGHSVSRIIGRPDGVRHSWNTRPLELSHSFPWRIARGLAYPIGGNNLNNWFFHRKLDVYLDETKPDVINVHNLHGFDWAPDLVETCARHAPTVWTLHDTWSFTGRCTFNYDCRKFIDGCDESCPTPKEYPALQARLIAGAWKNRKRIFLQNPALSCVSPSRWLARLAGEGMWHGHVVEVIPNGLPLNLYAPVDQELARKALGISTNGPLLLVVAQNLGERRKGVSLLVKALQLAGANSISLATMGSNHEPYLEAGVPIFPLGYIDHERSKVLAYSAADLLVHPSLADNFPNVILEAMACGTPVVAFRVGGIPEMVQEGITGWLAEQISPESLALAIRTALESLKSAKDVRTRCRTVAEAQYSDELQGHLYVDLFERLITREPEPNK